MSKKTALPPKWLRLEQLMERYGVSASTIWRWSKRDEFPSPVKLGGNTVAWPIAGIEEFEAKQAAKPVAVGKGRFA